MRIDMPRLDNLIVLIDDEPDIVGAYKLLFEQEGFEVMTADSPETGLALYESIKENPPRFTALDVKFKTFSTDKTNGFELCKKLKAIDPDGIFIVLTGMTDLSTDLRLIDSRADRIVRKPASAVEILNTLHSIERDKAPARQLSEKPARTAPSGKTFLCAFAVIFGAMMLFLGIGFAGIVAVGYHFYAVEKEAHARELKAKDDAEDKRFGDFMLAMRDERNQSMAAVNSRMQELSENQGLDRTYVILFREILIENGFKVQLQKKEVERGLKRLK